MFENCLLMHKFSLGVKTHEIEKILSCCSSICSFIHDYGHDQGIGITKIQVNKTAKGPALINATEKNKPGRGWRQPLTNSTSNYAGQGRKASLR